MENKDTQNEERMTIQMVDVERIILEEIVDKKCNRESIACSYAWCITSDEKPDFSKINHAILEHRSEASLIWIKNRAWKLVSQHGGRPTI